MKPFNWINHVEPAKGSPPPKTFGFLLWSLSGSFKVLSLSGFLSILTGITEVSAVLLLGLLIDAALNSTVEDPLGNNILLFSAGLLFFLLIN